MDYYDRFKIGVFGSAQGNLEKLAQLAYRVGYQIAAHSCILVTGGCPGLPYEAAKGTLEYGGLVLGFSPAINLEQHKMQFKFPVEPHVLIFTGFGLKGRNVISTRTCDAAIFISGRAGTLNEFTNFWDEGDSSKVTALLSNTGGVVDNEIPSYIDRSRHEKPSKTELVYGINPEDLVALIFRRLTEIHKKR